MENQTFTLDTQKTVKQNFLEKVKIPFNIALLLTGISSIGGVIFIVRGIVEQIWKEMGTAQFVQKGFSYLSIIFIFISLVKMLVDEKPFSRTLSYCIRLISALYLVGAVLFPRLSGYQSSGFTILSSSVVLIDGAILSLGLLLYIFSVLIEEGFSLQKEVDEIL